MALSTVRLTDPDLYLAPHPVLHRLRREDPVHWSADLAGWVLTRYDDIATALRDKRLSSTGMTKRIESYTIEEQRSLSGLRRSVEQWMGLPRPDDHRRLAKLLHPHFSARGVAPLEPWIRALARRLVAGLASRGGGDIVTEFAQPYTTDIIAHVIGLPTAVRSSLLDWATGISEVFHVSDFAGLCRAQNTLREMEQYLRSEVDARRRTPGDDLISLFIEWQRSGFIAHEDEIIANLVMLIAVGFETTANLIASAAWLVLENRSRFERLRQNPSLVAGAVEEAARYEGPVFMTTREARAELTIRDRRINAGDAVLLCIAAANRDQLVFPDPDMFVLDRSDNRHLGFGAGLHVCVGAHLARMEVRVALEEMIRGMARLALAGEPEWYEFKPLARWLAALPVRC